MFCAILHRALCNYSVDFLVQRRRFLILCRHNINLYTQYMCNRALYTYINVCYVEAPTLEAATPTVFMAWLRTWHSLYPCIEPPGCKLYRIMGRFQSQSGSSGDEISVPTENRTTIT